MGKFGKFLAVTAALFGVAAPASAQILFYPPDLESAPVNGDEQGLFVPQMVGGTPEDIRANLIWNLRSSLNVAALNCQFWPSVMSVDNYNAILTHHADELNAAYEGLKSYFRRTAGRQWQSTMDEYTTTMYQSYVRVGSQRTFCTTAAQAARDALAQPKGQLYLAAQNNMRAMRSSLISYSDATMPYHEPVPLPAIPRLDNACWRGDSYDTRRC
ncbi:hypothetical protein [Parasphingopyxis marina]|uniref:TIGR02301 family protein n=1 Tax=Parasphingopyxis marina TaxID=2761622 RepID=A0A842I0Z4_9SPHN|nr:hypothetical protein [Parasphingopyxis marina]MBC2777434.1 hypothetical protein [Parasphingopyxis marina]